MEMYWAGRTYVYEPGGITVKEAIVIKSRTGKGLVSWEEAIRDMDPEAIQCLLWLIKSRNGEPCEVAMLDFDMLAFMNAYAEGLVAAAPKVEPVVEGKASDGGGTV